MTERIWATVLPDGRTFRCVESQLSKTEYTNPFNKDKKIDSVTLQEVK